MGSAALAKRAARRFEDGRRARGPLPRISTGGPRRLRIQCTLEYEFEHKFEYMSEYMSECVFGIDRH